MISVKYGSLDMQADGVTVTDSDVYSTPKKDVQTEKLAETDGSIIVKTTYESKIFTVNGYMQAVDIPTLDALIDTVKAALNLESQNFDIDYAGSTRRYIATADNIIVTRPTGMNTCTFSVEFTCASPVGADTTTSTLLSSTAITTTTAQPAITVSGSYQAEPLILLTLTSLTGGTSKTVTIQNGSTLRGISVTRNWANGDVLEIDSFNMQVFVNNAIVPVSGQFPRWDVGAGTISYIDNLTTRSASITATYTRRFL